MTTRPKTAPKKATRQQPIARPAADALEVVDPIWLVKAIGLTVLAALICAYATLCLLFYQGQWQLVLHPARSTARPATISGAPFEVVRFGVDESAAPQLVGWWIPAAPGGAYAGTTLLYLPDGDGSLTGCVPTLAALHAVGVNVFAFDYRGYGQSGELHPNEERMNEDAASAWKYLTISRALPGASVIPFGDGIGASLAAGLAASHPEIHAVILQSPRPDLIETVQADPRVKLLPVRLLFHDRFVIGAPLKGLKAQKLILVSDRATDALRRVAAGAATPKMIVTLPAAEFNGETYRAGIIRFLGQPGSPGGP